MLRRLLPAPVFRLPNALGRRWLPVSKPATYPETLRPFTGPAHSQLPQSVHITTTIVGKPPMPSAHRVCLGSASLLRWMGPCSEPSTLSEARFVRVILTLSPKGNEKLNNLNPETRPANPKSTKSDGLSNTPLRSYELVHVYAHIGACTCRCRGNMYVYMCICVYLSR